jgi:hypothetical protein
MGGYGVQPYTRLFRSDSNPWQLGRKIEIPRRRSPLSAHGKRPDVLGRHSASLGWRPQTREQLIGRRQSSTRLTVPPDLPRLQPLKSSLNATGRRLDATRHPRANPGSLTFLAPTPTGFEPAQGVARLRGKVVDT